MRIRFERSGGFANIPLRAEIDSSELRPERAKELKRLVERAHAFDQSQQSPQSDTSSDQFQYEMTIEDGGRSQKLRISDQAASDDLKLLFDFLGEEALHRLKRR